MGDGQHKHESISINYFVPCGVVVYVNVNFDACIAWQGIIFWVAVLVKMSGYLTSLLPMIISFLLLLLMYPGLLNIQTKTWDIQCQIAGLVYASLNVPLHKV